VALLLVEIPTKVLNMDNTQSTPVRPSLVSRSPLTSTRLVAMREAVDAVIRCCPSHNLVVFLHVVWCAGFAKEWPGMDGCPAATVEDLWAVGILATRMLVSIGGDLRNKLCMPRYIRGGLLSYVSYKYVLFSQ
jgi:hypothetical protein